MGKVRTLQIKNISKELVSKYPDVFTTDFEENKHLLDKYLEFNSKHLRNRISGYIVSLMKMKKEDKNKVFQ
ncbi:MAG: 30S ribosomal protein S17e [Nanoarchaeota archaeon]